MPMSINSTSVSRHSGHGNHCDPSRNELSGKLRQPLKIVTSPPILNRDAAALYKPFVGQSLSEGHRSTGEGFGRAPVQ
jgi:hypothetical protein